MINGPRTATFRRWRTISRLDYSIYRALEYERLAGTCLNGLSLDIGGGQLTSYLDVIKVNGKLASVNINPDVKPSVLADFNVPLPFRSGSFDNVLSLNTLEHVFEERLAVSEILRVLKPGGAFHIGVPFLYRIHGSPEDFNRHTASWWERTLRLLPVEPASLTIDPLVWDPVASAFSIVEFTRIRRALKKPVLLFGLVQDRPARRRARPIQHHARRNSDFALGYFITGRKRCATNEAPGGLGP